MDSLLVLWLPIVLSAVAVFIISSILHTVLTYHNSDYKKVPNEDQVMDDLRKANIPPGDYMIPYCTHSKERKSKEFQDKLKKGPVVIMTMFPAGEMGMAASLISWFIYCLLVSIFAAYVVWHALVPGAHYLLVFRIVAFTAIAGYSLALMQNSIWFRKNWNATLKSMFDGLIYALVTAGIFGWLWPAA
jgi:hypothetical protein